MMVSKADIQAVTNFIAQYRIGAVISHVLMDLKMRRKDLSFARRDFGEIIMIDIDGGSALSKCQTPTLS